MAALTAPSGCCACGKCGDVGWGPHSSKSVANTLLVHSQVRTRTEVQIWRRHLYIHAVGCGVLSFLISNRWPCHQMHCTLLLIMPKPNDLDSRRLKIEISVMSLHFALWGPLLTAVRDGPAPNLLWAFETLSRLPFQNCRCKQGENTGSASLFQLEFISHISTWIYF